MTQRYGLSEIREFWTKQALEFGESHAASWSDRRVMEMEITEILQRLEDGDRVLDLGCANGWSTLNFAVQKRLELVGLDYIPEMIEQARRRLATAGEDIKGSVSFDVGDITALAEPSSTFDKLIVIRVVINLADWTRQCLALRECVRVLKPGGLLLLSEATVQGWQRLNALRAEWRLPPIPMPPFNLYLDENAVVAEVAHDLELVDLVNFASTYFVGTRVLKPLLAQALQSSIDYTDPDMEWNRWFSQLPAAGDYGTQKLFVFRKR